ncbi:MAG: hypothetical protein V9G20_29780 [Candidatus Promineifilaceae bacterium]
MHLATGAVVNAVWDLLAKAGGQAGLAAGRRDDARSSSSPCIDFRYLTDAITPDEALAIFRDGRAGQGRAHRARSRPTGYPCYTTSAGWLGYSNEKLTRLASEAVEAGFNHIKMKVGRDLDDDIRRLTHRARDHRAATAS